MTGEMQSDMEKGDLRQFRSGCPTLNNTPDDSPQQSRDSSVERSKRADVEDIDVSATKMQRTRRYLETELDPRWMGSVIIVCFFTSGLIDSVAFNSWNCFVGMQTGNTVFAALGIGGQPQASHAQQYYKSLVSIASFCVGTLFFNFLHRYSTGIANQPTGRRRSIFAISFMIQTSFILIAAILVQLGLVSNRPFVSGSFSSGSHTTPPSLTPHYRDLVPISLLAFEAAGQVCLSRVLSLVELPTIVLSTLYHDFTADLYGTRQLWKQSTSIKDFVLDKARRQEKRFLSIAALFCGALVGGEMYKSVVGMAGALWLATGLKFFICVAWFFWGKDQRTQPVLPK